MCMPQNKLLATLTQRIIWTSISVSPGTVRQSKTQMAITQQKLPRQLLKRDDQNSAAVARPEKEKKWGFLYIYSIQTPHKKTPLMPQGTRGGRPRFHSHLSLKNYFAPGRTFPKTHSVRTFSQGADSLQEDTLLLFPINAYFATVILPSSHELCQVHHENTIAGPFHMWYTKEHNGL